jgi:putative phosphoesterase
MADKLLVFSDTHGRLNALIKVFRWALDNNITSAAFLGDGIEDLQTASRAAGFFCNWHLVRGNNDFNIKAPEAAPEAAVLDFNGLRFFLCHGNRYALYNGNHALITAGRNAAADAVLFGHSHVPYCKKEKDMLLINPGSVGLPRSKKGATFAVIDCTTAVQFYSLAPEICEINI